MKSLFAIVLLFTLNVAALRFDSDVPKSIQDQMITDLAFMNQITGTGQTPFHQQIFSGVDGGD